uniref:LysM peptidoglycan-binding domain-containing protein n=1 Tax=Peribacillus simplex TaxID=1478 RepID=UPI0011DD27E2|nr:LysM domain-containing protein [Peribacillus simplex]
MQEGDTLWSIAHKDGTGGLQVEDLINANPGIDPTKLKIGQKINFGNETIRSIQKTLNSRYKSGLVPIEKTLASIILGAFFAGK